MKNILFLFLIILFQNSCTKSRQSDQSAIPTVTTLAVTNITEINAESGGIVTNDGGEGVTSRGVCWSNSAEPTIADYLTSDGIGMGNFTSTLDGLSANTTYHIRAYAINKVGTAYGNEISFTTTSVPTCSLSVANFAGTYKLATVKYKVTPNAAEVDGTNLIFESCQLDDQITFSTNLNYVYSDIGAHCEPVGSYSGTWSLNGSVLTTDGDPIVISNFSCAGFAIAENDYIQTGDKITITYLKQ